MLVFVHMHKTGGTTLSHILRSTYGVRHCQVEPWHARWTGPAFSAKDLQGVRKLYPSLKSIAGHRVMAHADLHEDGEELKYFTLMRDPIKLCASRFQFKVQISGKKDLVFEEWIQQEYPRNHQTKWIAGVEDANEAIRILHEKNIFVGLTERFDESMVMLKALVAPDLNISYKRVNVAPRNSIKERLLTDERTRQMLIDAQQEDLALYNYVKQQLYPSFQREYGPSLEADVAEYQKTKNNNFNYWNLTLCRMKHYSIYKPLLLLHRKGIRLVDTDATSSVWSSSQS